MILIVDDKVENLVALSTVLRSRGLENETALSGEEALKKVLRSTYDLIILDVQMPVIDGFEVAEALTGSSRTAGIPIIFLSAVNVSKEFIARGYASGGRDYLVKPFDTDILILKIQTFMRLNQIQLRLQKEIEQRKLAESKKDEFIGIASHELNTPLTSIKGYLQLAQGALGEQKIEQTQLFLRRSENQVNKLNALVTELLDTTRIESGRLKFHYRRFDFEPFLRNAIDNICQAYPGKHVRVSGDRLQGIKVVGDENRLEQVLVNYLSNAMKYAPESDEAEVEVRLAEEQLQVSVRDFGIGIPFERQQRLFEKFYRVDENSTHIQGLGMGLYICAEIIRRHQGVYGVKSAPGKGSTFFFRIPLNQPNSDLN
jgi:signal transduction histidine kinase